MGLLGSYGYDINSGFIHDVSISGSEDRKLPRSSLDSKVADFLKEIDDLDASMPSTNVKLKKKEKTAKKLESEVKAAQSSAEENKFSKFLIL